MVRLIENQEGVKAPSFKNIYMLYANELSVGNIVRAYNQTICTITGILSNDTAQCEGVEGIVPLEDLYPVELTNENILMSGFVRISEKDSNDSQCFQAAIGHADNERALRVYLRNDCSYNFIVFVIGKNEMNIAFFTQMHKLQNLYFALAGEELKIRL